METDLPRCETPNTLMSPVMNVVSSPSSSSPLLPSMSSMLAKSTSPSIALPSSPQSQTTPTSNKRKSSTPSTNPNRFDGVTEEEVAKRLLIDILQPNLDIVFVSHPMIPFFSGPSTSFNLGGNQSQSLCRSQGPSLRRTGQSFLEALAHVRFNSNCI